ncbi:MAG TPA: hypothetical protein VI039_13580 [Solirubrobacterales bacterium]
MQMNLTLTDGVLAGAWIKPRLGGQFGSVTLQVPMGFEAYARIFHPPLDSAGTYVKWAEVAKACGTTPHPEMQWHAILGLGDADELRGSYAPGDGSGVKWAGSDPPIGGMDIETLDALCEILAAHTADPTQCLVGLCTIQGWLDSLPATRIPPLLNLPMGRSYIILAGELSATDQISRDGADTLELTFANGGVESPPSQDAVHLPQREAPNLIWPADHSWYVASEVDFDSTLIGASATLINAIIESPTLEALPIEGSASLADDADTINVRTLPET